MNGRIFGLYTLEEVLSTEWFPLNGIRPASIHFDSVSGGKVQIRVSNSPKLPTNDGVQAYGDINDDLVVVVDHPYKWIKIKIIIPGSQPVNAWLMASV